MDLHQQMHVIRFPAEFQKRAAPVRQDQAEGFPEIVEKFRREGFSPIFCHKNNVQLNIVYGMGTRSVGLVIHVT